MRSRLLLFVGLLLWLVAVAAFIQVQRDARRTPVIRTGHVAFAEFAERFLLPHLPPAERFDFPLMPPHGARATIVEPFGRYGHLGQDWETAPGDHDIGEPVYAVADGLVTVAVDLGASWGKVVQILHRVPTESGFAAIESMVAHLSQIEVEPYSFVQRGQRIGTLGNADGTTHAHVGFELRAEAGLGLGPEYSAITGPWLDPALFIQAYRPEQLPSAARVLTTEEATTWKRSPSGSTQQ